MGHAVLRGRLAQLPIRTASALPTTKKSWSLRELAGNLVELTGTRAAGSLTAALGLVVEAQRLGEPTAWITRSETLFYPPDAAAGGVDLRALAVIRVDHAREIARAADLLLRSGAFGLAVLDFGDHGRIPMPMQMRLLGLAQKNDAVVLAITRKVEDDPSLSSLVTIRGEVIRKPVAPDRFANSLRILKDKRCGPGWRHTEVCGGPNGLH
jgi:recombination protein RecA